MSKQRYTTDPRNGMIVPVEGSAEQQQAEADKASESRAREAERRGRRSTQRDPAIVADIPPELEAPAPGAGTKPIDAGKAPGPAIPGTCGTCFWWQHDAMVNHGVYAHVGVCRARRLNPPRGVPAPLDGLALSAGPCAVMTGREFGCRAWEAKEDHAAVGCPALLVVAR
jgi:hypothetical protein